MSQSDPIEPTPSTKPLWPVAAVILLVVFTPAFLAWAMTMLRS